MTDALSALAAGLLGTLASVATQRFISARHPGLQSLSRWVMVASMVAGAMLAGVTALVGVFTTLRAGGVVEVACAVVVLTQIGGWLLFLKWLRPSLSIRPTLQRLYPVRTRLPLLLPQRSEGI